MGIMSGRVAETLGERVGCESGLWWASAMVGGAQTSFGLADSSLVLGRRDNHRGALRGSRAH